MRKLLSAEFRKPGFLYGVPALLVLTAVAAFIASREITNIGKRFDMDAFAMSSLAFEKAYFPLWGGAFSALFIVRELETGTLCQPVMRGFSRQSIFLAKALMHALTCVSLSLIGLLFTLFSLLPDFPGIVTTEQILICLFVRVVCDLGMCSISFIFAFLFCDSLRAFSFSAAYALLGTIYMEGSLSIPQTAGRFLVWHYTGLYSNILEYQAPSFSYWGKTVLLNLALIFVLYILIYRRFDRLAL